MWTDLDPHALARQVVDEEQPAPIHPLSDAQGAQPLERERLQVAVRHSAHEEKTHVDTRLGAHAAKVRLEV